MKTFWRSATACLAMAFTPMAWAETINFSGHEMSAVGVASLLDSGDLQLTPDAGGVAGGAWLTTPWSSADSFQISFDFALRNGGGGAMADGVAFVLQNQGPSALGAAGRDVGFSGLMASARWCKPGSTTPLA